MIKIKRLVVILAASAPLFAASVAYAHPMGGFPGGEQQRTLDILVTGGTGLFFGIISLLIFFNGLRHYRNDVKKSKGLWGMIFGVIVFIFLFTPSLLFYVILKIVEFP